MVVKKKPVPPKEHQFTSENHPSKRKRFNVRTIIADIMSRPLGEVFDDAALQSVSVKTRKKLVAQILTERMLAVALNTGWSDKDPIAPGKRAELMYKAIEFFIDRTDAGPIQNIMLHDAAPPGVDENQRRDHHESILRRYVEKKYGITINQEKSK